MHADEAGSWDNLHERFEVERIDHQKAYSPDGAWTHHAEKHLGRLRRAEIGIHPHIAGVDRVRHAQDSAQREDHRRLSNADRINRTRRSPRARHAIKRKRPQRKSAGAAHSLIVIWTPFFGKLALINLSTDPQTTLTVFVGTAVSMFGIGAALTGFILMMDDD